MNCSRWARLRGPLRLGALGPLLWLLGTVWSSLCLGQSSVLWKEGFEQDDFWDRWHVEGGVWAVGNPTTGPQKAFTGLRCAATVLDGNYTPNANARLVRDRVFTVPAAGEHPRLRFWHWWRGGAGATRSLEIQVGTQPWQVVAAASGWAGEDWSRALVDLSPFSGQSIQIAFHFQSSADTDVAAGWYVDDVTVETGTVGSDLLNSPEGFESGLGNWTIDHGVWEVGLPTAGPDRAFAGTNCVGTVLGANYGPGADSRLISPEFVVPAASDNPRLRFWHWFSVWPDDPTQVEISVGGGPWQPLSGRYSFNSSVWTRPSFDLRAFAGRTVQIAFHFQSNLDSNVATGWYVDEVVVETGSLDWNPVNHLEGFEAGLGHWVVDSGTWEVGNPSFGPTHAFNGSQCAGTVLGGNYGDNVNARLISPEFTVPAAGEHPRLRFWQWLRNQVGDPATVEVRTLGGDWRPLLGPTVALDGTWARAFISLDAVAGQRVQIAFHFQSNDDSKVSAGWFIDDFIVETGPTRSLINQVEDFENGIGDWSVETGTWEIGTPDTWPENTPSGTRCAGTILGGNHLPGVDSRLISPEFVVPAALENPRLRFSHWFNIWPGDFGEVQVSVAGGPWQSISPQFFGSGVVWTRPLYDLRALAGQSIRLAFHFQANDDANVGLGWYIDDVVVETGPSDLQTFNGSEGFESGLGNWSVDNGTWALGLPRSGPGQAFKGTNCVGTVVGYFDGKYVPNTDSRLISPEFAVPCADAGPRLRFAQWYDIAAGDEATLEVRVAGGDWQPVIGPTSGSSHEWITGFYDLAAFAGKRIQIAFHFRSNDDNLVGAGWFVDEVKLQASVLQAVDSATVPEGELYVHSFGSPCQNLRYDLGVGAPAGVAIEPTLGILTWLTTEEQGPGVYSIPVCVSDLDHPATPIQCVTMEIMVLEVNSAPQLHAIDSKTIQADVPLQFTVVAEDSDLPAQKLTFSLESGAPYGAQIDAASGLFSWTPTPTQATTVNTITVRVTDSGDPPLSVTTSFNAAPSGPISAVRLQVTRLTPELITVCIQGGVAGTLYNLETSADVHALSDASAWSVLQQVWKGDQDYCETTHSTVSGARFYRVRRADP